MNFLAHLHLAEATPASRLGSLLGDFVKGMPWDDRFPSAVWRAIVEHRAVDAFTDRHPAWRRSRDLLPAEWRRFAGIVIDVCYDHLLHRNWSTWSAGGGLDAFIGEAHEHLERSLGWAPPSAALVIERMIEEDWLRSYGTLAGVKIALERISRRAPALAPLADAPAWLNERLPAMEGHFLEFYPELIAHVATARRDLTGPNPQRRQHTASME